MPKIEELNIEGDVKNLHAHQAFIYRLELYSSGAKQQDWYKKMESTKI